MTAVRLSLESADFRGMSSLDPHQQAAVAHGDGPAIVLAGPGSGKTRVIVERTVRLIDDEIARPEELLVLTFSRRAARDLKERIARRLRRSYASFPVTTFHAFCLGLLTRDAAEPPRLVRPAERREAMRRALAAHANLDLRASAALTEEGLRFAELSDDYLDVPDNPLAPVRERYLTELDGLDYGGLQREAVALLERGHDLPYRYVLVDEYQDTDVAQERLLKAVGPHGNVFCVADEDQSIYGFRGAEIDNALEFERNWPGAIRYDLPTNYRSAPAIVELSASVIRRNVDTHRGKALAAAEEKPAELGGRTFRHAAEEADWIAREIAGLRLDGTPLGEIAILARSLREVGPRLAYALRRHNIPFYAPLAPTLHPTVDALLSLLDLATAYPWDAGHDERALRTLASPLFGADPLELRSYRRERRTLYGSLRDSGGFEPFFEALGIVKRQTSGGAAIYALWERLGHFRTLQVKDATREQIEELAAITALSDAANDFGGTPAAFVEAFRAGALETEEWLPTTALPPDEVALLTIHQAKGLEWEAVFVCDLVEGRFPALGRSQHALFAREDFSRRPLTEAERARRALEEERRLFYVALTRARSRLALTATEEAREEAGRSLSRFYLEAQSFLETGHDRTGFVSTEEALAALRRAGGGPPGWREREETENPTPMVAANGLYTSASNLAPYENCPLQFYLGSFLELARPSGAALVFGGVLHDVLEAFHDPESTEPQSLDRLLALGDEKWRAGAIRPAPLEAEQRRRLDKMLTDYWHLEAAPGIGGDVLAVERYFRIPFESSTLSGRIDRIDRLPDGRLRLLDYKSGKPMTAAKAEEDLQLALYAVACAGDEELAALGEVGEIVYLFPGHTPYGRLARRGRTVTPDLVDRTSERIRGLFDEIAAERFAFSPDADCMFCEFKRMCPRHVRDVPL